MTNLKVLRNLGCSISDVISPFKALVVLLSAAPACMDEDLADTGARPAEILEKDIVDDPVLHALSKLGDWEPLAHPLKIADGPIEDRMYEMTETKRAELVEAAAKDLSWFSSEGERYEALYVLENGTAYGRKGPAPSMPPPNTPPSNQFGLGEVDALAEPQAGSGVHGPSAQVDDLSNPVRPAGSLIETDYTSDGRARKSTNLNQSPWRLTGAISGNGNTQSGGCSGTKVGPRAVLSASHCFLTEDGMITGLNGFFNPGQSSTATPNGSIPWNGLFLRDWRLAAKADYAVFYLADSSTTYNLGWMDIGYWDTAAEYTGVVVNLSGYPCGSNTDCGSTAVQRCAASPRADKRCDGWMYSDASTLYAASFRSDGQLEYSNDCSFGQSGAAMYMTNFWGPIVLAVQTEAPTGVCRGPRFQLSMWNDVCTWIANPQKQSAFGNHSQCN
jgi:V8-like Glu-specific endopeptidase